MERQILTMDYQVDHIDEMTNGNNQLLLYLETKIGVSIEVIGDMLHISGQDEDVRTACQILAAMDALAKKRLNIDMSCMSYVIYLAQNSRLQAFVDAADDVLMITHKGRSIRFKTLGQKIYTDAILSHDLTLCTGPAGTGKTFLAVAMAVKAFRENRVSRIILARPAVEAGERLGFLPGDLKEKVDPYMRPIYDALHELFGEEATIKNMEKGTIEVSPLAFMRGRTLDDAFIILDEAQNATIEQMKMFLTRIGMNAKACVCGDITQIDLPCGVDSGLCDASSRLSGIDGICVVKLTDADVVRNPLVQKIIRAYNSKEEGSFQLHDK